MNTWRLMGIWRRPLSLLLLPCLLAFLVSLYACLPEGEQNIKIRYENNTDSQLCLYHGSAASPLGISLACLSDIQPMSNVSWSRECVGDLETATAQVVLIEAASGQVIYARSATCMEWLEAGSTIVIDRHDDAFFVTDGFP